MAKAKKTAKMASANRTATANPTPTADSPQPWYVYILRCDDDSLYTGITKDLLRRVSQHNAGKASRYTRCRLPVAVEYHEMQPDHSAALKRELAIKALPRKQKQSLIKSVK